MRKMIWYESDGRERDVVVSSRVRLARNLEDYPFSPRLGETAAREIIEKVKGVFEGEDDYTFTAFSGLSERERIATAESHRVSREFAVAHGPTALVESDEKQIYIMVLEEDHIRLQSIMAGLSLKEAYEAALEADRIIDGKLRVAFDEKLGYLTHCPTNLGTGMRASVMLFLPALTYAKGIGSLQEQLGKIGLTIRGMSGEGSDSDGCLYQISNQITLGLSEDEILTKLMRVCEKIIEQERALREKLKADPTGRFNDKIMRSYGTLMYATMIDSAEMMRLYADVRLGASLGIIENVDIRALDEMIVRGMPATLMSANEGIKSPSRRDAARAVEMRRVLAKG